MKLTDEFRLNDNPEEQKAQIENALRDISQSVDGTIREFIPTLYGSTTAALLHIQQLQ